MGAVTTTTLTQPSTQAASRPTRRRAGASTFWWGLLAVGDDRAGPGDHRRPLLLAGHDFVQTPDRLPGLSAASHSARLDAGRLSGPVRAAGSGALLCQLGRHHPDLDRAGRLSRRAGGLQPGAGQIPVPTERHSGVLDAADPHVPGDRDGHSLLPDHARPASASTPGRP